VERVQRGPAFLPQSLWLCSSPFPLPCPWVPGAGPQYVSLGPCCLPLLPERSLHTLRGCLFFVYRGIVASILVFLCFGVTQAKDGPFSRPHPGNLPFLSPCVPHGTYVLSGHSVSVQLGVKCPVLSLASSPCMERPGAQPLVFLLL
jgi:hypothetical protein